MFGLSIKDQEKVSENYRIVLTVNEENSVVSNIIGGIFKTIDEAIEYLAEEDLNYVSALSEEGKSAIKFIRYKS